MGLNMTLAKKWAAVPGVTFPAPMTRLLGDKRCTTVRLPQNEWISASKLAKHLGVTSERANAIGMRADGAYRIYVDPLNPVSRTRFFRRSKVMGLKVARTCRADDYAKTHVPLSKAMELLGVGRGTVAKYVRDGKLNPVHACEEGKKGIHYLYSLKEISNIKKDTHEQ